VVVEVSGGGVTIKRAGPPTESYVDYFATTYSRKLNHEVSIRKLLEEERIDRLKRLH